MSPFYKGKRVENNPIDAPARQYWNMQAFKTEKDQIPYELNYKLLPESQIKNRVLD